MAAEFLAHFDRERLNKIVSSELVEQYFWEAPRPSFFAEPRNALDLYKVSYNSTIPELGGQATVATGLLALPQLDNKPRTLPQKPVDIDVVMYQHGTTFTRDEAPSCIENSMETRLTLAQFGGQGFCVMAADYFGKGGSNEPDSYLIRGSTERALLDMLTASKQVLADMGYRIRRLFLTGWSQGGWSTLVFLQALQKLGVKVTAAAIASAPTDPAAAVVRWTNNPHPTDANYVPGVLAIHFHAHEHYHGRTGLAEFAIKPEYLAPSKAFYESKMDWDTFLEKTTPEASKFVTQAFIEHCYAGEGYQGYSRSTAELEAFRFVNLTPLRVYYGDQDEAIPVNIARLIKIYQDEISKANVTEEILERGANHRETFLRTVSKVLPWFQSICAGEGDN